MKDFDISKLDPSKFDPSKIDLDPTKPLTWVLAAAVLIVLLVLTTIVVIAVQITRSILERRGQRKAMERAEARNLERQSEPLAAPLEGSLAASKLNLPDSSKPTVWPLEPIGS